VSSHGKQQQVWRSKSVMSFLRYVEGSIPGKKLKRPASEDERQVAKKKYDQESRERKFLPQWTKDRSWLDYDGDKQLMFCNWCRNHEVDSVFVKGICYRLNKYSSSFVIIISIANIKTLGLVQLTQKFIIFKTFMKFCNKMCVTKSDR
jgi:hypothetical protein